MWEALELREGECKCDADFESHESVDSETGWHSWAWMEGRVRLMAELRRDM